MGLIGTALGAVGSIFGGLSASKAMKKAREGVNVQRKQNEDWYNRRYNEDVTQRADAQSLLNRVQEAIRNRNNEAQGVQAVMGGTEESTAATKASNNDALANVVTNIAVNGEARKDAIEGRFQEADAAYRQKLNDIEVNKANAITQAVKGVTQSAGDMDFGTVKVKGTEIDL